MGIFCLVVTILKPGNLSNTFPAFATSSLQKLGKTYQFHSLTEECYHELRPQRLTSASPIIVSRVWSLGPKSCAHAGMQICSGNRICIHLEHERNT